jgi:SAM-dependent methyltransferase
VNHYFGKSWEEWNIKRARGKASLPPGSADRVRMDGVWHHHNRNDEEDNSIARFRHRMKEELDRIVRRRTVTTGTGIAGAQDYRPASDYDEPACFRTGMVSLNHFVAINKPTLQLSQQLKIIYDDVDNRIADHDHMNAAKNFSHYFSVGASALSIIQIGLTIANLPPPRSILDFACGAGRVTRWLRAAYREAHIVACDMRDADLKFQNDVLGTEAWKSSADFERLTPTSKFDLIWVGSLLSHLSEQSAASAMTAFMKWLNPGGLLIVSFHGRRVRLGKTLRGANYISDAKFAQVEKEYNESGYGYEDYDNQKGLGFSMTKPQWFFDFAARTPEWKIVGVFEAAWDQHHDVCIVANSAVCVPK